MGGILATYYAVSSTVNTVQVQHFPRAHTLLLAAQEAVQCCSAQCDVCTTVPSVRHDTRQRGVGLLRPAKVQNFYQLFR